MVESSTIGGFLFFLIIIIVLIVILILVYRQNQELRALQFTVGTVITNQQQIVNNITNFNQIQPGVTSGSVDTLITNNGSVLYVKQVPGPLNLQIPAGNLNIGSLLGVVNGTPDRIHMIAGTEVTFVPGIYATLNASLVVLPGTYGQWIVTNNNTYLRVI